MADFYSNKPFPVSYNGVPAPRPIDQSKPRAPRNVFVTHPYIPGTLDIRWDNPTEIQENSRWTILGVNIYRSIDSEIGPYTKINNNPVEIFTYRDRTFNQFISNEDILPRLKNHVAPKCEWLFTTLHKPIVKEESQNVIADTPRDVLLRIDNGDGTGLQIVPAYKVFGRTGEIFLIDKPSFDPVSKRTIPPRLPEGPNAKCYCSYWVNQSVVRNDLYPRYFYKVTCVGRDQTGNILETRLEDIWPSHVHQLEKPDYIWKGVIARNRYLLEQFGERAKLFMRKMVGETCPNYSDTHLQAHNNCNICFGTGIIGGYIGPFDVLIAPPEAEKQIEITNIGLRLNYAFESWTGPNPLLRTGDLIVRQNGERFIMGSVTPQGAKGAVFQQHFRLNYRDSADVIYNISVHGGEVVVPVADDTRNYDHPVTEASPQIPAHKSERAETEKGRSVQFENVTW